MDAIRVDHLVKHFGKIQAVRDVSFTVRQGEIFGLLGPNGAGKTTTIRVLLSLLQPTSGSAHILGVDVERQPLQVRRLVGWVPQEHAVDLLLTGRENLLFVAGLYHVPRKEARLRAEQLLHLVDLEQAADRIVRTYSGGMRRRLELTMGLVQQPQVLFLDEPTLGLDIQMRRRLWSYIESVRTRGTTILLTTHYLEEADMLCDRIAIIDHGQIQAIDKPDALKEQYGQPTLAIEIENQRDDFVVALQRSRAVRKVVQQNRTLFVHADDLMAAAQVILIECGHHKVRLCEMSMHRTSLDDVFLSITGYSLREQPEVE